MKRQCKTAKVKAIILIIIIIITTTTTITITTTISRWSKVLLEKLIVA
jgi:hypothetical protein